MPWRVAIVPAEFTEYALEIGGVTSIVVRSEDAPVAEDIRDALIKAIESDPLAAKLVTAEASGSDVLVTPRDRRCTLVVLSNGVGARARPEPKQAPPTLSVSDA